MSIEKLRRVIWRLKEIPTQQVTLKQVQLCIMAEVGTDNRTVVTAIRKLMDIGMLKRHNYYRFSVTGKDLEDMI